MAAAAALRVPYGPVWVVMESNGLRLKGHAISDAVMASRYNPYGVCFLTLCIMKLPFFGFEYLDIWIWISRMET